MIAYLEGQVLKKFDKSFILVTNGVGYLVSATTEMMSRIGTQVEVFIYSNIKEDAFELFGFESLEDKDFFEQLISVNKVGPKTAINILELGVAKVRQAISESDVNFLKKASGLGKKGAERIILELQGKLPVLDIVEESIPQEVFDALTSLGYRKRDVELVLASKPEHNQTAESIIKFFLQNV